MTTTFTTQPQTQEAQVLIDGQSLAQLLTVPVGPAAGRQFSAIYRELLAGAQGADAAALCRRAWFILDNLSFKDAENYSSASGRKRYSGWFHDGRKKLMAVFLAEAQRLQGD